MAVSIVSVGSTAETASNVNTPTTLTPGLPATRVANRDTLLCLTVCAGAAPTVSVSGWQEIFNITGTVGRIALYARVVDGTEAAPSVVWAGLTTGVSGTGATAQVAAVRDLDYTVALSSLADKTSAVQNQGASTTVQAMGNSTTTPAKAGQAFFSCALRQDNDVTDANWPLIGTAENLTWAKVAAVLNSASGTDLAQSWQWAQQGAAASTVAKTVTVAGASSDASTAVMVSLKTVETVPLGAATAVSSATCAVTAPTLIQLATLGSEIITNTGFETDLTGWSTSGTAARDTSEHHSGAASLKLSPDGGSTYTSMIWNAGGGPGHVGKTYKGSVWVKAGLGEPFTVFLQVWSGDSQSVPEPYEETYLGTGAWQQIVTPPKAFTDPASTGFLGFGVYTEATTPVYLDDLSLKQVTAATGASGGSLALSAGYNAAVDADTPVSHWKLGEPSGVDAVDRKGLNPGTYRNTPLLAQTGLVQNNNADKAVTFNGTDEDVTVANSDSLGQPGSWTLEAWIKFSSVPGATVELVSKGVAGNSVQTNYGLELGPDTSGALVWCWFGNGTTISSSPGSTAVIPTNTPAHVVGVFDDAANELRIYVNGVLSGTQTGVTATPFDNSDTFEIASFDGLLPFGGTIDEVAFYDYALTTARVLAHYDAGKEQVTAAIVPLGAASAVSSATLALSAKTTVPLGAASAVSSASLALTAPTRVPLGAASAVSSATLAVSAKTTVPLGAASAQSSATLALTAPTRVPLGAASAQSSATLTVYTPAGADVQLGAASAVSSASLALTAKTTVPLQAASAAASASLALTAPTVIPLGAASGQSSATLTVLSPRLVPLGAAAAQSSATLALRAQTFIPLNPAAAVSSASLALSVPGLPATYVAPARTRWPVSI